MKINSAAVTIPLYGITFILSLVHVSVLCAYYWINDENQFGFIPMIDFDYESNIPTLFTTLLFIFSALLLAVHWKGCRQSHSHEAKYWFGLILLFVFLGFDEGIKIHEFTGDFVERFIVAQGYLYFPWFIPYSIALLVLTLIYFRFYLELPVKTKKQLFLSALVFLSAAIGLDIIGANEAYLNGTDSILYSILYTAEEIMEMVGLIIFITALIDLLSIRHIEIKF